MSIIKRLKLAPLLLKLVCMIMLPISIILTPLLLQLVYIALLFIFHVLQNAISVCYLTINISKHTKFVHALGWYGQDKDVRRIPWLQKNQSKGTIRLIFPRI